MKDHYFCDRDCRMCACMLIVSAHRLHRLLLLLLPSVVRGRDFGYIMEGKSVCVWIARRGARSALRSTN